MLWVPDGQSSSNKIVHRLKHSFLHFLMLFRYQQPHLFLILWLFYNVSVTLAITFFIIIFFAYIFQIHHQRKALSLTGRTFVACKRWIHAPRSCSGSGVPILLLLLVVLNSLSMVDWVWNPDRRLENGYHICVVQPQALDYESVADRSRIFSGHGDAPATGVHRSGSTRDRPFRYIRSAKVRLTPT